MGELHADHIERVIDWVRLERRGEAVSLEALMRLAEVMAEGFRSAVEPFDIAVSTELEGMAHEIDAMKRAIAGLELADMRHDRIPEAGRELDAIVEATEAATNTIMSAAEAIMAADPSDRAAYQTEVSDRIIAIFEACSFQDITGQRISKVVATLNHLDTRISTLVERLKLIEAGAGGAKAEPGESEGSGGAANSSCMGRS